MCLKGALSKNVFCQKKMTFGGTQRVCVCVCGKDGHTEHHPSPSRLVTRLPLSDYPSLNRPLKKTTNWIINRFFCTHLSIMDVVELQSEPMLPWKTLLTPSVLMLAVAKLRVYFQKHGFSTVRRCYLCQQHFSDSELKAETAFLCVNSINGCCNSHHPILLLISCKSGGV